MTNNKTEKIVFNILRWIMVLPSVILTIFLVQIVAGLLINFDWQQEPGFMLKYIAPLIYGGVGGYAAIHVGKFVTPKFEKYVVWGILILFVLAFATEFYAIIMLVSKNKSASFASSMQHLGRVIGSLIAYWVINFDEE